MWNFTRNFLQYTSYGYLSNRLRSAVLHARLLLAPSRRRVGGIPSTIATISLFSCYTALDFSKGSVVPFFDALKEALFRQPWEVLLLPTQALIPWIQQRIFPGLPYPRPTILSLDAPTNLLSFGQALAWHIQFLETQGADVERASSLVALASCLDLSSSLERDDLEGAPSLLKQWMQWWSLKKEGAYSPLQSPEPLLDRWEQHPPQGVLVVEDPQEKHSSIYHRLQSIAQGSTTTLRFLDDMAPWKISPDATSSQARNCFCASLTEQARTLAFFIREALSRSSEGPGALPITLTASAPSLLAHVQRILMEDNIFISWEEPPLSSLLRDLLAMPDRLWAQHPLLKHALIKEGWLEKHLSHAQPLGCWIRNHRHAVEQWVPGSLWQDHALMTDLAQEALWEEADSLILSPKAYLSWIEQWTKAWIASRIQNAPSLIPLITSSLIPFFSPTVCLVVPPENPFPWIPQRVQARWSPLALPLPSSAIIVSCSGSGSSLTHRIPTSIEPSRPVRQPPVLTDSPPLPPLSSLSLTDLQLWRTDFQAFYLRRILHIRPLTSSSAQEWGIALHALMEQWIRACPPQEKASYVTLCEHLRGLAKTQLPSLDWVKEHFVEEMLDQIALREWEKRQQWDYTSALEVTGRLTFSFPEGTMTLRARADRIDYLEDGSAHIIDYKTGVLPSFLKVDRMNALQLPLEALMVQEGGFGQPAKVTQLSWWHLTPGECKIKIYPRPLASLLTSYRESLHAWLQLFVTGDYG